MTTKKKIETRLAKAFIETGLESPLDTIARVSYEMVQEAKALGWADKTVAAVATSVATVGVEMLTKAVAEMEAATA
jgi:hypothetical protein